MSEPLIILASRSARRALLLREAGLRFVQTSPPFDDPPHPESDGRGPAELAMHLASCKAESLRDSDVVRAHPDAIVVAADTLIVHDDGELAGTPTSREAAGAMIRRFCGVTHAVVTGVAMWRRGWDGPRCFADVARVAVGHVDDRALEQYLASGQWQGKAGGYNLFERQEAGWPITVEGDQTTVVGLPMRLLSEHLERT